MGLLGEVIHGSPVKVKELPDGRYPDVIEGALGAPGAEFFDELARLVGHGDGHFGAVSLESIRDFLRAVLEKRGGRALAF
ncbi:MAG: hypothetical protein L6Q76_22805 [Polyangiaceae bacterium]|nr:hypothetical protein [Polyangiaceae bacterium]